MDTKVFEQRNIIDICNYVLKYCEFYINTVLPLSDHHIRSFHTFLPTLLVYIFGSPATRGWIQTETQRAQDDAIKNLLSVNGHFFQALIKLSYNPEYSYDLVTESLPADVKRVLSSGAIHLLPRVYSDCSYLNSSASTSSVDIRAAATRQSTLLPSAIGGDRRIKFNTLQFYLYYFASVATWPPLNPPNNTNNTNNNLIPTKPYQYGTVRNTTTTPFSASNPINTNVNSNNTNTTPPYLIPGNLRSITCSVYDLVLEEYLIQFVPIGTTNTFPTTIQSFFLDALVELWVRTPWISTGQKLSTEYIHYISTFVKYIVRHDLKQCINNENSLLYQVYTFVKEELYMLISRLALNWSKHDDYLQVVDLWATWAAPWKLGTTPRSFEKEEYLPISHGWAPFILENIPFYIALVDILLQRTSTFQYKDGMKPQALQPTSIMSTFNDSGTIGGQLRILYRIINVIKAKGLVEFLGNVEKGLENINSPNVIPTMNDPFKYIAIQCYGAENMDYIAHEKIRSAYHLLSQIDGGAGGIWKPKGLYTNDIQPRSEPLLKTLNALHNEILLREDTKMMGANPTIPQDTTRSVQKASQLKEAYDLVYITFKVTGTAHLMSKPIAQMSNNNKNVDQNAMRNRFNVKYATTDKQGFLSKEDLKAVQQGKLQCSTDNIHALGVRAKLFVRSYEIPILVRWSLRIDEKLNYYYNRFLPNRNQYTFLPQELTVRPLAATVNLVYITILLMITLYIFIKIIF